MAESAREIDLDPRRTVGLSFPIAPDENNDFAVTETSTEQAPHNLRSLFLTFPGERVGQPEFGSRLRALCFEPLNKDLPSKIENEIYRAVDRWLPYINITKVDVLTDEGDRNKIFVKVDFTTSLNPTTVGTLTVTPNLPPAGDY